jgi:hypothetical protein
MIILQFLTENFIQGTVVKKGLLFFGRIVFAKKSTFDSGNGL